jgi:hypothetical protein
MKRGKKLPIRLKETETKNCINRAASLMSITLYPNTIMEPSPKIKTIMEEP